MFLLSKDRRALINMDQMTSIYVGADGCTLKVDFGNGKGCQVGRYNTLAESQTALEMLAASIGKTDVISAPEDGMVEAKINQAGVEKQYRIAGKKAKSHGAS